MNYKSQLHQLNLTLHKGNMSVTVCRITCYVWLVCTTLLKDVGLHIKQRQHSVNLSFFLLRCTSWAGWTRFSFWGYAVFLWGHHPWDFQWYTHSTWHTHSDSAVALYIHCLVCFTRCLLSGVFFFSKALYVLRSFSFRKKGKVKRKLYNTIFFNI